jgi:hypothetical protein
MGKTYSYHTYFMTGTVFLVEILTQHLPRRKHECYILSTDIHTYTVFNLWLNWKYKVHVLIDIELHVSKQKFVLKGTDMIASCLIVFWCHWTMSTIWSQGEHIGGRLHGPIGRLAVTPAHVWILYLTIGFLGKTLTFSSMQTACVLLTVQRQCRRVKMIHLLCTVIHSQQNLKQLQSTSWNHSYVSEVYNCFLFKMHNGIRHVVRKEDGGGYRCEWLQFPVFH